MRLQEHVIVAGNPGSGKSSILNCIIGDLVFESGISLGSGLTTALHTKEISGVLYSDTPGGTNQARVRIHSGVRTVAKQRSSNDETYCGGDSRRGRRACQKVLHHHQQVRARGAGNAQGREGPRDARGASEQGGAGRTDWVHEIPGLRGGQAQRDGDGRRQELPPICGGGARVRPGEQREV
ncbi:50S ribosome-binding GTPase [Gracilaria domingensis]|nr:50S ribosome-binding GTPase [Gracilaria domingensis]